MEKKRKRRSSWDHDPDKIAAAEAVLRESRALSRDPERLLRTIAEGRPVRLPRRSDLGILAGLFESLHRGDFAASPLPPDAGVLRHLWTFCRSETDLLTVSEGSRYANALLALSAHHRDWVRPLESWRARTYSARRQFRSLLRHLIALYDVPVFLDAAWLDGLDPAAIRHQGWYKHIARGRNIRTAAGLPLPLTKKQAHHFLRTPDDFAIPAAFRRAQILDLGGDERLVRSILGTRIGTTSEHEAFWASVVRFFVAHPGLEPVHHGPIVDFLHHQKFVPSVPNPLVDQPGQPPLVPLQPRLCIKGRTPDSLRRAVAEWHRDLARSGTTTVSSWEPSGFVPLVHEEGTGDERRTHLIVELLTTQELLEEGREMSHCVASYAHSCASGRTSIWSLRRRIDSGRVVRRATIEVRNKDRTIVQVRRRRNAWPTEQEWLLLEQWGEAGGPKPAVYLAT